MANTIIRFTQRNKSTGADRPVFVSGVRFADGAGYKVKAVQRTTDRSKAARFSTATAVEIAAQFYMHELMAVELANGGELVAETVALRAEQERRFAAAQAIQAEFNRSMAPVVAEIAKIVNGL